jgi:protein-disulfide isomerase
MGQKVGITGTPGFFVNGIAIKGAQPFEVFQKTIDEELARSK